ncbi:MAG: branched-chain-amino-acid transaminase [Bacteroidota bacterium]|jgi:branched-chain amino acid aminotransferase
MASYYNENTVLFHNGTFVKAVDAKIDLYSQSLHYGYSVFEGIRSYKTVSGATKIFKATEHFDRFKASAEAINLPYTYNTEDLIAQTYKLLDLNNLGDAYIRPMVYAPANMSFTQNTESFIFIQAWEMGPFLGDKRIRVMTSSFQRPNPKGFKIHAKAAGHYVNSIMASQEAKAAGYDEALLLDMHDHVAEAPGANVFFEKDGTLYTPSLGNILPGITRATVLELCATHAIPVVETSFGIDAIKGADAAFFCGTAAEVIGLESIDDVPFTKNWDDTASKKIQLGYQKLIRTN